MIIGTLNMVKHISERDFLEMEEMDERLSISMKFYNLIMAASYLGEAKREMMIFFTCRMVQLTMKNGLCKYSILAFIQFAAILCSNKIPKIVHCFDLGLRLGKAAMSCSTKRYHTSELQPNMLDTWYPGI
jgi:hypothetical protein